METSWKHGRRLLTSLSSTMQNYPSILTVLDGRGDTTLMWHLLALGSLQCAREEYWTPSHVHNMHRPITITIRSPVTATHCPFRRRFNLKKANWSKFTNEIDQTIANIPAHPNHYNDFVDLVKKAARHNINRGCQKEYIPGLSDESSDLLKLYDEEYNKYPFSESTIQLGSRHLTG